MIKYSILIFSLINSSCVAREPNRGVCFFEDEDLSERFCVGKSVGDENEQCLYRVSNILDQDLKFAMCSTAISCSQFDNFRQDRDKQNEHIQKQHSEFSMIMKNEMAIHYYEFTKKSYLKECKRVKKELP